MSVHGCAHARTHIHTHPSTEGSQTDTSLEMATSNMLQAAHLSLLIFIGCTLPSLQQLLL